MWKWFGRAVGLSGGQLIQVPLPYRVFGNSWDSDEDAPTRPQPHGHVPKVANSDGYCSHNEDGTNGETEARRGTATCQGQTAVAAVSGGEGAWGLWEVISRGTEADFCVSPHCQTRIALESPLYPTRAWTATWTASSTLCCPTEMR